MTDSQRFTLITTVKKDIQNMGFSIEIFHNQQIQLASDNFNVIWKLSGFKIFNNTNAKIYNQEQWDNYSAEIDNLNRAILWVNTKIKDIVLSSD